MRRSARRVVAALVGAALVGTGVVAADPSNAVTTTRSIDGIHWTKSTVNVTAHDQRSRVKVHIVDSNGVCDVQVRIAKSHRSFLQTLVRDSGTRANGVWGGSRTWRIVDRGTWRVTRVVFTDCAGKSWVQTRTKGLGTPLSVVTTKPVPTVALSSVPATLLRGATDTAKVRLSSGGTRIKNATVRLRACANHSYRSCTTLGSATTDGSGNASIGYTMPTRNVVVFATYGGSSRFSQAQSRMRSIRALWKTITVGVTVTGTFDPPDVVNGTLVTYGLLEVHLDRRLCNGSVTISGVAGSSIYAGSTRGFAYCTSVVEIQVLNEPPGAGSKTITARLLVNGRGKGDSYVGTSPATVIPVPPPTPTGPST